MDRRPHGRSHGSRTENGGLRIDARQEHQGEYVALNGDVRVIDDKTFMVTGGWPRGWATTRAGNPAPVRENLSSR